MEITDLSLRQINFLFSKCDQIRIKGTILQVPRQLPKSWTNKSVGYTHLTSQFRLGKEPSSEPLLHFQHNNYVIRFSTSSCNVWRLGLGKQMRKVCKYTRNMHWTQFISVFTAQRKDTTAIHLVLMSLSWVSHNGISVDWLKAMSSKTTIGASLAPATQPKHHHQWRQQETLFLLFSRETTIFTSLDIVE